MSAGRREGPSGRRPRPRRAPKADDSGRSPQGLGWGRGRAEGWGRLTPPAARPDPHLPPPTRVEEGPPAAVPRVREKVDEAGRGGRDAAQPAASAPACAALAHAQCPNWRPTCRSRKRGVCSLSSSGWGLGPKVGRDRGVVLGGTEPVPGNGEERDSDVRGHKQTCGRGAAARALGAFILGQSALEIL